MSRDFEYRCNSLQIESERDFPTEDKCEVRHFLGNEKTDHSRCCTIKQVFERSMEIETEFPSMSIGFYVFFYRLMDSRSKGDKTVKTSW